MTTMLTLHEVPTVVCVCSQCPPPQVGLKRAATIERRVGVGIILSIVEETVDAAIEGNHQLVGYDVPLIITFEIEEVTLIVSVGFAFVRHDSAIQVNLMALTAPSVGLCLKEMSIFTDVFLHVAVGVDAIIAL